MSIFLTSVLVIILGVVVNIFVVPRVLWLTTGVGNSVLSGFDNNDDSSSNSAVAFVAMLGLLVAWAYLCFTLADWLAGEEFGQRWVLLFTAAALAGGPYSLFQRRVRSNGIASRLVPPLQSAMEYAGGIQSLIVVGGMLSGIYYDWWPNLPG